MITIPVDDVDKEIQFSCLMFCMRANRFEHENVDQRLTVMSAEYQ